MLPHLHPGHEKITWFRVYTQRLAPCSDSISLRLPYSVNLATECKSLTHYAKGTQSPLMRLLLFVCMRFQVLFHSPPGVLFAFPSRYWFTIGRSRVFSLGGWSPHLQTGCHVSRPTYRFLSTTPLTSCKGLSPSMAALPRAFHCLRSYQKLGWCNFARRYFRNLG